MRLWRRAAKQGPFQAQLKYGLALYRGSCGCAQDAEEARLWLLRAVRGVTAQGPAAGCDGGAEAAALEPALEPALPPAPAETSLVDASEEALRRDVERSAALVLGYMSHDGEGARKDAEEAVR